MHDDIATEPEHGASASFPGCGRQAQGLHYCPHQLAEALRGTDLCSAVWDLELLCSKYLL